MDALLNGLSREAKLRIYEYIMSAEEPKYKVTAGWASDLRDKLKLDEVKSQTMIHETGNKG